MDLLPPELQGQVESELLAAPFFLELAVVLPQYRVLLLSDTGGAPAEGWGSGRACTCCAGLWASLGQHSALVPALALCKCYHNHPPDAPLRGGARAVPCPPGFCMSAEEYGGISPANISAARGVGVWDRLGPITKQVFEGSPKVSRPAAAPVPPCLLCLGPGSCCGSACLCPRPRRHAGIPLPPSAALHLQEGRAWVEAVLAREDWDTVIPGHATAPILDGKRAFKDCYDFLY